MAEAALIIVSLLAAGLAFLLYRSERKLDQAVEDASTQATARAGAVVDAEEAQAGNVYADPEKSGRLIDEVEKRFGGPE